MQSEHSGRVISQKEKKDLSDFNKRFQARGASRIAFVGDLSFINN